MKKIYLLVVVILSSVTAGAQNIYYDAMTLKRYIKNGEIDFEPKRTAEEHALEKSRNEAQAEINRLATKKDGLETQLGELRRNARDNASAIRKLTVEIQALDSEIANARAAENEFANELKIARDSRRDSVYTILRKYNLISAADITDAQVNTAINANRVFMLPLTVKGGQTQTPGRSLNFNKISSAVSNIGGIDVTNIVNALADVMIEHAKQELTVAFFNRFKKFAEENPEFGVLFPKTTSNLQNLLSYKYPEMLPTLRTGFLDDLQHIAFRLEDVLELPRYEKLLRELPEVRIAIRFINIVHELETGASNAADVIADVAAFKEWDEDPLKQSGYVLKIAALFSESIRNKDGEQVWVPAKDLKNNILMDETASRIFIEFIYQTAKAKGLKYPKPNGGEGLLHVEMEKGKADITNIQYLLREFFVITERVNVSYKEIKHKKDKGERIEHESYYTYINTSIDAIQHGVSWLELVGTNVAKPRVYLSLLRDANDLYKNIYSENYNQAVVSAFDLLGRLDSLFQRRSITVMPANIADGASVVSEDKKFKLAKSSNVLTLTQDSPAQTFTVTTLDEVVNAPGMGKFFFSSTGEEQNSVDKLFNFLDNVKPYALFITNVVEADTEEEMKNVIENAILPVGSSSLKKYSCFNIAVQSYLGARVNMLKKGGSDVAWNKPWGVIAPVGVAFSWGGRHAKQPASYSIFTSLLDIGAIVDYRLTTDEADREEYQIKLGQIFSPGLYFVYGLPWDLPISVGIGTQYGPGVYKIDNGAQTIDPEWKLNAFIAVDIPLFNVHNKANDSRKKRGKS